MMLRARFCLLATPFLTLMVMATRLDAQEPRLAGRLPGPVLQRIDSLLDAARRNGLPTEPLVDRALEGLAKGAAPDRIEPAVLRLSDELRLARTAFGDAATAAELMAGASAIRAGATTESLLRLRESRPDQPLTVPAGVLADLVAAGVDIQDGVTAVLAIVAAEDADYVAFRRNVERDIALGASPAAALGVRLRGMTEVLVPGDASVGVGSGGTRRKRKP